MNIAKKSVKFSFDFSNAQISPMTINGCGGYNLENVTIPLVGYTLSMDGDTFDGHCDGEISFTYLDIDDILEKLKIVGTDSYFDQEYERIRQRIIQEGRQRYGDDFDEYEDVDRSELNDFELNYSLLTQRMWDNLKLDIKSAKLSKFTLTGKWSSWDDSPDVDEWKEGIKGSLTVDITDADGNTYHDIKVKFDESTAFVFGEEAFDYMESAIYTANERDDGYMASKKMLSKNDTVKSMKESKIAKREWEGKDYSPIASEKDIERALREEYSRFDSLVKLEYVGTDWAMGSQYWVALFKKKGGNSESFPYACVTVIDWTYDFPQRGIITDGYVDGELDEMKSAYQHKVDSLKGGTRKSMMKSKGEMMKSVYSQEYGEFASRLGETWDFVYKAYQTLDDMCRSGWCPQRLFSQVDGLAGKLEGIMRSLANLINEYESTDLSPKSAKKSKSVMKSKGEKMKSKSVRKGKSINWSHKVLNIERVVRDIENELYDTYWDNAPDRYWTEMESNLYHQIDEGLDELESAVNRYYDLLSDADYSASAKKSKRELLKAKVDELLEEEDDEIAKPRMKDMFLDSKRKSRKSTKSNNEKGEDADEYREESDGDDVSDSKVVKPEEANDNEDENEAPSGGNFSLPEDADGQENQSTKRKKRMSKFSVTAGGSQPYNGRENYNQSPMMREAIDRFKAEKDLVKSLQDRVDEINGARKNTEVNNKSPLRIKGRY